MGGCYTQNWCTPALTLFLGSPIPAFLCSPDEGPLPTRQAPPQKAFEKGCTSPP